MVSLTMRVLPGRHSSEDLLYSFQACHGRVPRVCHDSPRICLFGGIVSVGLGRRYDSSTQLAKRRR